MFCVTSIVALVKTSDESVCILPVEHIARESYELLNSLSICITAVYGLVSLLVLLGCAILINLLFCIDSLPLVERA